MIDGTRPPGRSTGPTVCRGHSRGERGMVAGAEALALGTVVVIVGMLLVVNAWAVLDTRTALESAAREYLRAYTEADSPEQAQREGRESARAVLADRPALAARVQLADPPAASFGPCATATVELAAAVPAVRLPLRHDGWGSHTVTVRATELVDAHQEMQAGWDHEPERTVCSG